MLITSYVTDKVCSTSDHQVMTINCCIFPKDSYRALRDQNGDLENVVLIYRLTYRESNASGCLYAQDGQRGGKKKVYSTKGIP